MPNGECQMNGAVPDLFRRDDRPSIVCLCGSTRFMAQFFEEGWELTLRGHIVLSVGVCKHAQDHGAEALGQDVAEQLDELHKRKIDLADWIVVLNVGGYVGNSTASEIEYAIQHGKPINWLEPGNIPERFRPAVQSEIGNPQSAIANERS